MLTVWQTGVQYHMFHALGLILLGSVLEIIMYYHESVKEPERR